MTLFRKILVPTDFSPHSVEAVRLAAAISTLCRAPITVMTAVAPDALGGRPDTIAFERVSGQLAEEVTRAKDAGGVNVASVLIFGAPVDEILRYAREEGFDLIVMGTHGRTGLKHALLGSVAETIVARASCPVLTVRV